MTDDLICAGQPQVERFPPLVLAYVGDSVYELYVRTTLARGVTGSVHKLHTEATAYSRCSSQADVVRHIFDNLSKTEQDVVRRGRNAHSGYVPKNADVSEYRHATGFEALLGYLYLGGEFERLDQILKSAAERVYSRGKQK